MRDRTYDIYLVRLYSVADKDWLQVNAKAYHYIPLYKQHGVGAMANSLFLAAAAVVYIGLCFAICLCIQPFFDGSVAKYDANAALREMGAFERLVLD